MRTNVQCLLGFCLWLLAALSAEATVMYSTVVDSKFTIAADDVKLGIPFDGSFSTTGNGVAGFSGSATTDGVFPAKLHVEVSGSAFAPPESFATSTFMSGHIFTIDNTGGAGPDTVEISVPFAFTYSWVIGLSRDYPATEFASAGAFFDISGIDNEFLFVDGVGFVSRYLDHIMETTAMGGIGSSGLVAITGKIVVPAETLSKFSVITDTTGMAVATVPEPSMFILFALGIVGLVASQRWLERCRPISPKSSSDDPLSSLLANSRPLPCQTQLRISQFRRLAEMQFTI